MIRLAIRVGREQAELALAELLELAPGGLEETELDADTIEYAVYGPPGELPALPDLEALAGGARVEISTTEVADDWQERWREFHRPVLIPAASPLPALRLRPPWEAPAAATAGAAPLEVVIDPGQAFGTGGHATTRLCLELLLELLAGGHEPSALLDVGTGSGVLAIAAARLGFEPVLGLDNDPESIAAAASNAAANGVDLPLLRHELRREALPRAPGHQPTAPWPVVLANLLRPLLLELSQSLSEAPDHLIAGGLLVGEADEVAAAFASRLGLQETARRSSGEWAALWLSRA